MLSTYEVRKLCDLPMSTLNRWVNEGVLTPAQAGRRGSGNTSYFTPQQALGLAVVASLHQSERGCSRRYARRILRMFGGMSDEALRAWFRDREGQPDLHNEEVLEANTSTGWLKPLTTPVPDDDRTLLDLHRRLLRVEARIRGASAATDRRYRQKSYRG